MLVDRVRAANTASLVGDGTDQEHGTREDLGSGKRTTGRDDGHAPGSGEDSWAETSGFVFFGLGAVRGNVLTLFVCLHGVCVCMRACVCACLDNILLTARDDGLALPGGTAHDEDHFDTFVSWGQTRVGLGCVSVWVCVCMCNEARRGCGCCT